MIISRTPLRMSFFGGGTDYPLWYRKHGGAVLATTINKYCYITCRYLPPFFDHKSKISYSKIELIKKIDEIQHPAVRACLRFMSIEKGIEIHCDADLPARTGLGSGSTFTVGLLHTLYALRGAISDKRRLALDAIHVEQKIMKDNAGSQDQVLAAFGGFNFVKFGTPEEFCVQPVTIDFQRLKMLQDHLLLFFTGFSRSTEEIAVELLKNMPKKKKELEKVHQTAIEGMKIINSRRDIAAFGKLLHEYWKLKRGLSARISTSYIDEIYKTAMKNGALGGKILGAGGGGFILIFAKPEIHSKIKKKLKKLLWVPFRFENLGSQIIFYNPWDYRAKA